MQRAKLKFMNLFTTICVTRLRRDSGKERHYQASYSPPAGYALVQHSRAKRITRSLKENAAPPVASRLGPGTVGLWPEMERKKADCRARWKTFKPWLLARGKQKRPGWRFPAAARSPARPRSPGRAAGRGPRGRPGEEHWGSARSRGAPRSPHAPPWPSALSGHPAVAKETSTCEPELGRASLSPASRHTATPGLEQESRAFYASGTEGTRGTLLLEAGEHQTSCNCPPSSLEIQMMGSRLYPLLRAPQPCRIFPWRVPRPENQMQLSLLTT